MAALLLGAVLVALAVVTLPVALALIWANARGSVALVTVFGAGTVAIGWAVMHGGVAFSAWRLTRRGPEFVTAITPSR
jgi:ethanolamine transporter EutH